MTSASKWYQDRRLWLDGFALVNLTFLGPDIYLAHSMNSFRHRAEYVPLFFSLAAPGVLLLALLAWSASAERLWRVLGHVVGISSILVGIAGLLWHLQSQFFQEGTLASLVYTAPFAAPLAYTGIGLLLLLVRMVDASSADWPRWVLLLALGGFIGNFIFSLADHAQNGFFYSSEWIPVGSSALAIGFLLTPFLVSIDRRFVDLCYVVLLVQVAVGLLGFYYHNTANLEKPAPDLFAKLVYGAPPLAPLLFPNLVLLALIGLWDLRRHLPAARQFVPNS
jgi:hypothetical protein